MCQTSKMLHLFLSYFVFLSGAVFFSKMVHRILQRGAHGAKILFIQQSGNEFEGGTSLLILTFRPCFERGHRPSEMVECKQTKT